MNYELFMGEALAEAQIALDQGKAPIGAVAVVNDAMVARAHDRVLESNDPTAHAVVVAVREAARKLGSARLADATIFVTREPCPMCVGALLACADTSKPVLMSFKAVSFGERCYAQAGPLSSSGVSVRRRRSFPREVIS